MRMYREILTLRGAWQFSAAGLLARSGGAMMGLGIVLMVSSIYGSYALAGGLAALNAVAWAGGTAVLSNLVDRYGQRRIMWPAALISATMLAVVVVLAVLKLPAWTLLVPVIVSGATAGAPGALVRARWSHATSSPSQLHAAFSLESTLDELTFIVGPVAATALSTGVHPAAGVAAPVVLGLLGAHLFYSQRSTEPPVLPRSAADPSRTSRRFVLATPGVAAIVTINVLIGCVFGAIDVSVVAATTDWGVRPAAGMVLAVFSVASAIAGFAYGARAWRSPVPGRFVWGVVAMFATTVVLVFARSEWTLASAGFLVGATVAPTLINGNTLVGRLVQRERLTEGLAWMSTGLGIGVAVGSSVSGALIDTSGYTAGLLSVSGFGAAAAVLAVIVLGRLNRADALVGVSDSRERSADERVGDAEEVTGAACAPVASDAACIR